MSKEEFLKRYGDEKVQFSSYYKFSFLFESRDGTIWIQNYGYSEDIYRLDIVPEMTISDLIDSIECRGETPDGGFDTENDKWGGNE